MSAPAAATVAAAAPTPRFTWEDTVELARNEAYDAVTRDARSDDVRPSVIIYIDNFEREMEQRGWPVNGSTSWLAMLTEPRLLVPYHIGNIAIQFDLRPDPSFAPDIRLVSNDQIQQVIQGGAEWPTAALAASRELARRGKLALPRAHLSQSNAIGAFHHGVTFDSGNQLHLGRDVARHLEQFVHSGAPVAHRALAPPTNLQLLRQVIEQMGDNAVPPAQRIARARDELMRLRESLESAAKRQKRDNV